MNQDRFILQRTAEGMHSAVRHIGNVVDWLSGDGEKTYGGVSVKGEVEELRRMKPVIIEALEQCCAWIRDEWPHIENNKARLHELARKLSHEFCIGFSDEDLESLIRDHELPMLTGASYRVKETQKMLKNLE